MENLRIGGTSLIDPTITTGRAERFGSRPGDQNGERWSGGRGLVQKVAFFFFQNSYCAPRGRSP